MGFYDRMKAERLAKQANAADGVRPKYKVLQVDMMKSVDKERATAVASFVRSGQEAYRLEGQEGFAYKDLDLRGRCGVICYRGMEVALLFKREVVEREPSPAEPVPERILKDPIDAWIQIDLLGMDSTDQKKGIGDRLRQALAQVERLKMLWQSEEGLRKQLEERLTASENDRTALKVLKESYSLMEANMKFYEKEIETLKRAYKTEVENRKTDKLNTVRELIPMFNTTWLAGRHRVGDQLYGIIKKQMVEVLGKIGIKLIEPVEGEGFDPEKHHAIHGYPFPEGSPKVGTIISVNRVGWQLGSVIVEAAEVAVGIEQKEAQDGGPSTATNSAGSF